MIYMLIIFTLLAFLAIFIRIVTKKAMHLWLPHYLLRKYLKQPKTNKTKHIMFCFVDHYEPMWGSNISYQQECDRVEQWFTKYPQVAGKFVDADGVHPQHSFFYPEEEYRHEHLAKLSDLCYRGFGEIEVHLHHDNDTAENLHNTLKRFTKLLHEEHGAFTFNTTTENYNYSFIHGNWCLDNSRPDGRCCGVNNELQVLLDTGCYADFTFPSAPSDTQPAFANEIYYATGEDGACKSHNKGNISKVGYLPNQNELMLITGPLGLNWLHRKKGIFPQIENSDIRSSMLPTKDRIDLWVKTGISVEQKPEWIFIKIHTHGTQEQDMNCLLGKPFSDMCEYLDQKYNDGEHYVLHYVSAREMYNIAKAAEAGKHGNPNEYRDYLLKKPSYKSLVEE